MDIKDYFNVLARRKWIIILTTISALAIAIVGTQLTRPVYQASTTLRVAASAGGPLNYTASTYSNQLINTTAQIAASRPMLDQLATRLNLKDPPVVTAEVIPDTELIKITVEYSNPQMAAQIANTLAGMLIDQSNQLYTGGKVTSQDILKQQVTQYKADLDQAHREYDTLVNLTPPAPEKATAALASLQLKERTYDTLLLEYNDALGQQEVRSSMMTVVEEAVPPKSYIQPQVAYNYILGLALGLLLGAVLAFAAESFDPTLSSAKGVEQAAALDIVGQIPSASKEEVHMSANDTSSLAEGFRNLAMNLMLGDHQQSSKVLLITSAEPQQGKSTVAANLATALAEYGKNTVVIDCDLRRPKLHEMFDLPNESGLTNILEEESDLKSELKHPAEGVSVITSGTQPVNPSQLLASPNMAKVMTDLRRQFDFVLLDTPALLAVSDTSAMVQNSELAQKIDEFLLVVRRSHAERDPVQTASKLIGKFSDKCAGVVLNQADESPGFSYYRMDRNRRRNAPNGHTEQSE